MIREVIHVFFYNKPTVIKKPLCMCNESSNYTAPIRWRVREVLLEHQRSHLDHLHVLFALLHNMSPLFDHAGNQSILCLVSNSLKVVLVCKDRKPIPLVGIVGRAIFTYQARIYHLTCLTASHCPCMVVLIQLLPLFTLCTAEATTRICPHRELTADDTRNSLDDYIRIFYRRHHRWCRARVVPTEHHKLITCQLRLANTVGCHDLLLVQ